MAVRKKKKPVKKLNKRIFGTEPLKPRKFHTGMKKKLAILFMAVLLALVGLAVRISYINATSGNRYRKQVLSQAQQKYESRVLPAKRGDIYDRNGNLLATSNKVYNVILDCKAVNADPDYVEPTVRAMTQVLGLDEEDIRRRLTGESTKNSQYQIVERQLSVEKKKDFEKYTTIDEESTLSDAEKEERRHVQGVWFEEDYLRMYPYDELACDAVGFTL